MRKRLLILALVLTLIAVLSAATYAKLSNHIVLHGASVQHPSVAQSVGIAAPVRPQGVPANVTGTTIILHGRFPAQKGVSPALAGGSWSCSVTQYAWAATAHEMEGDAAYNCSGATLITFTPYADYCSPVLWGCLWQQEYTFGGCSYPNPAWGSCPKSGLYDTVSGIATGQLWRLRSSVCAWGPPGTTSDCGTVSYQVQF